MRERKEECVREKKQKINVLRAVFRVPQRYQSRMWPKLSDRRGVSSFEYKANVIYGISYNLDEITEFCSTYKNLY